MPRKPSAPIWVTNAVLLTQDSNRRVLRAHLEISDGRISKVARSLPSRFPKGTRRIDASGLVVLPGFIQTHVHLCQTLFRNLADDLELLDWLSSKIWPMEAAHSPQTLRTSALLGIHELLSSGTTCILDMGTVRHTNAIFQAVKQSGIRANVGKCLMDHPETTPHALRESTSSALEEARELFRKWNGEENDRIRASYAPRFVISCTEKLLREVARLSHEQNALIHTHASENRKEIDWVRELTGTENIEYLHRLGMTSSRLVLAHCVWVNEREIGLLRETGSNVAHCPSSNLKLASGIAPIPKLIASGVNVSLGADGAPCNNNLNMFQEMRLAALIQKPGSGPLAMRAQDVLDLATRNGAKALGWDADIGTIEVGKKADLFALDLSAPENALPASDLLVPERVASAIVYASQPTHVRWTMVDGRVLYESGRVKTVPRERLMKDAASAIRAIRRRISQSSTRAGRMGRTR